MLHSKAWPRPLIARVLLGVALVSWSTGAAAQSATEPAPDSPLLTSDARADQAFKLQAEGLRLVDQQNWEQARDKLLAASSYGEFPNVAFYLATVYDKLEKPELAREQLEKFMGLADPSNANYAAALALQNKLRGGEAPARRVSAPVAPTVLIVGGTAMLLAAVTTGLLANAAEGELERNCPQNQCPSHLQVVADRGRSLKLATNILLAAGGAALGVGVAWRFSFACSSPHGCSAAITGNF